MYVKNTIVYKTQCLCRFWAFSYVSTIKFKTVLPREAVEHRANPFDKQNLHNRRQHIDAASVPDAASCIFI